MNQPASNRQHEHGKRQHQNDSVTNAVARVRLRIHHPQHQPEQNPSHQVVNMAEDMTTVPISVLQQSEIHQDPGDHRKSGNGQRRANKEREDQPVGSIVGAQKLRKQSGRSKAKAKRESPCRTNSPAAHFCPGENAGQINLNAGSEKKEYHADRGDSIQHQRHRAGMWERAARTRRAGSGREPSAPTKCPQ